MTPKPASFAAPGARARSRAKPRSSRSKRRRPGWQLILGVSLMTAVELAAVAGWLEIKKARTQQAHAVPSGTVKPDPPSSELVAAPPQPDNPADAYAREGDALLNLDPVTAAEKYRAAATMGSAAGQNGLAFMYITGSGGVQRDEKEALTWFRKAADQGFVPAIGNIGTMYANGSGGLAKDEREALKWIRKAAERGDVAAQGNLGFMYVNGRAGLPKDDVEGVRWLRKAALQGNADARAYLASRHVDW